MMNRRGRSEEEPVVIDTDGDKPRAKRRALSLGSSAPTGCLIDLTKSFITDEDYMSDDTLERSFRLLFPTPKCNRKAFNPSKPQTEHLPKERNIELELPSLQFESIRLLPGKSVEMQSGELLRIRKIRNLLTLRACDDHILRSDKILTGPLFKRTRELDYLKRDMNEVAMIEEEANVSISEVKSVRKLIITNAPKPHFRDLDRGWFICRWVWAIEKGDKNQGVIRRISENEADEKYRWKDDDLRDLWRKEQVESLAREEAARKATEDEESSRRKEAIKAKMEYAIDLTSDESFGRRAPNDSAISLKPNTGRRQVENPGLRQAPVVCEEPLILDLTKPLQEGIGSIDSADTIPLYQAQRNSTGWGAQLPEQLSMPTTPIHNPHSKPKLTFDADGGYYAREQVKEGGQNLNIPNGAVDITPLSLSLRKTAKGYLEEHTFTRASIERSDDISSISIERMLSSEYFERTEYPPTGYNRSSTPEQYHTNETSRRLSPKNNISSPSHRQLCERPIEGRLWEETKIPILRKRNSLPNLEVCAVRSMHQDQECLLGKSPSSLGPVLIQNEDGDGSEDDIPLIKLHRGNPFSQQFPIAGTQSTPPSNRNSPLAVHLKTPKQNKIRPTALAEKTRPENLGASGIKVLETPPVTRSRYTFGDAFCGGGGASCGADLAGFKVRWGVDKDVAAISTYRTNFPEASSYHASIDDFLMISEHTLVDVLHLSPPCQPYSPAHTRDGRNDEANQAALFSIGETLRHCRPRMATLEQTPGILNHPGYLLGLLMQFTDAGFSVAFKVLKGIEHGLPQNRKRFFVLAAGPGETLPRWPRPTNSLESLTMPNGHHNLPPPATLNSAILAIPPTATDHEPRYFAQPKAAYSGDKYFRYTIMAGGGEYDIHPSGLRPFTVRELACIQGFPVHFVFKGGFGQKKSQVGNAVPPVLGKAVMTEVRKALERCDAGRRRKMNEKKNAKREKKYEKDESKSPRTTVFDGGNDEDDVVVLSVIT